MTDEKCCNNCDFCIWTGYVCMRYFIKVEPKSTPCRYWKKRKENKDNGNRDTEDPERG